MVKTDNVRIGYCENVMTNIIYGLILLLPFSSAVCEISISILLILYIYRKTLLFRQRALLDKSLWFSFIVDMYYPRIGFLRIPILLLICAGVLSTVLSEIIGKSVSGFFFEFLQGIFLMSVVIEVIDTEIKVKKLLKVGYFSLVVVVMNGAYQYFNGAGMLLGREMSEGFRLTSSLKHANSFGGYLIFATILVVTFLLRRDNGQSKRGIKKIMLFLLSMGSLGCLLLTYSRGAWLGWLVAFILMMFLVWSRLGFVGILFVGVLSLVVVPLMKDARNVSFLSDNVRIDRQKKFDFGKGQILVGNGRLAFWKEGIHIFWTKPIFGVGLNTYTEVSKVYKTPHNSFLRMLVEMGFVGLLAFLYFLGKLFVKTFQNMPFMKAGCLKYTCIGVISGLSGFLVQSFVDVNFYSIQLSAFMWFMIGVIVATQFIDQRSGKG